MDPEADRERMIVEPTAESNPAEFGPAQLQPDPALRALDSGSGGAAIQPHRENGTEGEAPRSGRTLRSKLAGTPLRRLGTAFGTIFTGAVTAIVAGLVLGWFGGHHSNLAATQQIIFQPWATGGVSRDVRIVSHLAGTCWTRSSLTSRPDAYRCMAKNDIFDPCISDPTSDMFSSQVICPYPGPESATLITLKSSLPGNRTSANISSFRPWLITLSDGENCFAFSAFTRTTAGLGEDYTCPDGGLYNDIRRGSQPWTIFQLRNGSSDMTLAEVAKAYF